MTKPRGIFERPKDSGIWWIRYADEHGREHREKVGTKSIAIDAYRIRKAEVLQGKFIAPIERRVMRLTFSELADQAIEAKRGRNGDKSVHNDELMKRRLAKKLGSIPAASMTSGEIESYLTRLRHDGRSGPTVNRYRSFVSSVFSFAVRTRRMEKNPVAHVPRYKESSPRVRFLNQKDPEEETKIRAQIRKRCPERELELDLALHTGMRRNEQFLLKWKDVDLVRGFVAVEGKTGRRHIELNDVANNALRKLQRRAAKGAVYVCETAKRSGQRDWRRWFEECIEAAGIDNLRWHDLRHTFASRLVMAGVDLATVRDLMGHETIAMTMRYAHLSRGHRRAAINKLAEATGTATGTQELADSVKVVQMK